jgi:hypothetical protein
VIYDVSGEPVGPLTWPTGCSETSVANYQPTLWNIPEERWFYLLVFSYNKSCICSQNFEYMIKATFTNTDCHVKKVGNWLRLWGCMCPTACLKSCDSVVHILLHVSCKFVLHISPSPLLMTHSCLCQVHKGLWVTPGLIPSINVGTTKYSVK